MTVCSSDNMVPQSAFLSKNNDRFYPEPENNDYKSVIYLFFRFNTTLTHAWPEQSESTVEQYNKQYHQYSATKSENVSGRGSSEYEAGHSA